MSKERRQFTAEYKREALRMVEQQQLSVAEVARRLGIKSNLLYRWKQEELRSSGPVASSLEARVRELEIKLHRVERERDILKKATVFFAKESR